MSGVTRSELTVTSRRELEPQVGVQCQNWKTQQYIRPRPFVLNIQIQAWSFWASAIMNLSRAKRCHFSLLFIHATHGDVWQGGQIGQNWAASQVTSGQNNKKLPPLRTMTISCGKIRASSFVILVRRRTVSF